jgi:hypothetical protein
MGVPIRRCDVPGKNRTVSRETGDGVPQLPCAGGAMHATCARPQKRGPAGETMKPNFALATGIPVLVIGTAAGTLAANAADTPCFTAYMSTLTAHTTNDDVISTCTSMIQSGNWSGNDLSLAYSIRGDAYVKKGDDQDAIADYEQEMKLSPDNSSDVLYRQGNDQDSAGNYDRAIIYYTEAIKVHPDYTEAFLGRGTAYDDKGDHDHAIADYSEAISLVPGDYFGYGARCYARAEGGTQLDAALADCNKSLQMKDSGKGRETRGLVYLRLGRYDDAIADYNASIAAAKLNSDPQPTYAFYGRGLAKLHKGDKAGGKADIAKANHINPKVAAFFVSLGLKP